MFTVAQTSDGNVSIKATGDSVAAGIVRVEFAAGVDAEIGRGSGGITYLALRNAEGDKVYLSIGDDDSSPVVDLSTTKP